jgi:hypothetical protein
MDDEAQYGGRIADEDDDSDGVPTAGGVERSLRRAGRGDDVAHFVSMKRQ